jgi:hypothetical protein
MANSTVFADGQTDGQAKNYKYSIVRYGGIKMRMYNVSSLHSGIYKDKWTQDISTPATPGIHHNSKENHWILLFQQNAHFQMTMKHSTKFQVSTISHLHVCGEESTSYFKSIRVRIYPPHPHACRKRRLNGAVLRMRPEKLRSHVTVGVG